MATELSKDKELKVTPITKRAKGVFYVFVAQWNKDITDALWHGCHNTLLEAGIDEENIIGVPVPGTVELVNAAGVALNDHQTEGVIIIGCVIRGDTPHFDYVCQIVSQGTAILNSQGKAPVIFGVLTVDNIQQALDRAGGKLGNKGAEAGVAAVEMVNLRYAIL